MAKTKTQYGMGCEKANTSIKREPEKAGKVEIRMYCIGTGDCLVVKFFLEDGTPFSMMVDCGSCRGDAKWFQPYVEDLAQYVGNHIDLLIVTHEHQDHVNGFQKCKAIFECLTIKNAWFAWTEHPDDPTGAASELRKKRSEMKAALGNALNKINQQDDTYNEYAENSPFSAELKAARASFKEGLNSLAAINLNETGKAQPNSVASQELAGMRIIKEILAKKQTKVSYLQPGTSLQLDNLPDVDFHVLGPPTDRSYIYKEGKTGKDVYNKILGINSDLLAIGSFNDFLDSNGPDLPFSESYIIKDDSIYSKSLKDLYNATNNEWRKIDNEWLSTAGNLAIRLTSHINNTSLALAIESKSSGKVLLFPGDAEYGSWESWHLIKDWERINGKNRVEDLLNRTAFYKVSHHLSYNGTALEKGILMMPESNLVAMATLDRERISSGWKSTMPNKHLLQDLIRRTGGFFFIANEAEIDGAPSTKLDHSKLDERIYHRRTRPDNKATLFKQVTMDF